MASSLTNTTNSVCINIDPGVCGFDCRIMAWKIEKKKVKIKISESECSQVRKFSETLTELNLKEIFTPLTRNPVYQAAERSGCHPSCGVPLAVVKAAEVVLGMALPRNVTIRFDEVEKDSHHGG